MAIDYSYTIQLLAQKIMRQKAAVQASEELLALLRGQDHQVPKAKP